MRLSLSGLVLASASLLGCLGASSGRRLAHQGGDAEGAPRVEALPSLDVANEELTQEMRMARLLSAESLGLDPPVLPRDTSTASIAAWSDGELKAWLRQKQRSADEARRELDRAALQNHRQRIMAGALVGLVYEDLARVLLTLPIPSELASEPEIAAMYVDLLRSQASPYLLQSRQAYLACAGNADQVSELRHWSGFCQAREERLPSAGSEAPKTRRESKTTVTVLAP
jgi:hypothetical protein